MAQINNSNSTEWYANQQARKEKKANEWNNMLQMMAMSQRMNDQQMIGFALGKLLKDGWLNYKSQRNFKKDHPTTDTTEGGTPTTQGTYAASLPGIDTLSSASVTPNGLDEYAKMMQYGNPLYFDPEAAKEMANKIYGGGM